MDRQIIIASLEFSLYFLPLNSSHRPRLMKELVRTREESEKINARGIPPGAMAEHIDMKL